MANMSNKMKPALEILLERERERMLQRQEMEDMREHSDLLRSISAVPAPKAARTTPTSAAHKKQKSPKADNPSPSSSSAGSENTPTEKNDGAEATAPAPPKKACNCKKSNCLKLYCECFQQGQLCGEECNCQGCHNNMDFESQRQRAIRVVLERNPVAFLPKVSKGSTVATTKYFRGCRCRRSGCLKKYCECYQAGVKCGNLCRCQMCRNCCADDNHDHHAEHDGETPRADVASMSNDAIPVAVQEVSPEMQTILLKTIKQIPRKRTLSEGTAASTSTPKYLKPAEMQLYMPRQTKPKTTSRLYPLEASLHSEAAVQKICMSLVNAACLEESDKTRITHKLPPSTISRPTFASPLRPSSASTSSSSSSPAQFNSPTVDALLCSEDVDMTPQKQYEAGDRRSELQENAVLQEFSVWLRNIATASVNHLIKKTA